MIVEYYFELVRGDTLPINIAADGNIGTVSVITMTARRQATDEVLFTITGSTTSSGWAITIPASATQGATPGMYKYDVQFKMSNDEIYTPLIGTFKLIEDQTREVLT